MPQIILYDTEENWTNLLPLSYTRSISDFRIGILTIREKWEKYFAQTCGVLTRSHLQLKYNPLSSFDGDSIIINASILPNPDLIDAIRNADINRHYSINGSWAFSKLDAFDPQHFDTNIDNKIDVKIDVDGIHFPEHVFQKNEAAIKEDFHLITKGRKSQKLSESNQRIAEANIFVEEGAKVECAILNATNGPIYIGKNAEIMEGSIVRGPFALCDDATLKLGTKVYGATTIGPWSKVGGEVNNIVIFGYSNKGHDGFLGNAVIGEWCNLGADTNSSNLKNNYSEVRIWNYESNSFRKTGSQFCGIIMGDHSKCGINTMFNTGTVVGVGANIFGSGYPRTFIPSFAWGGKSGFQTNRLKKTLDVAEIVMQRRNTELTQIDKDILAHIFEFSSEYRKWD